MEKVKVYIQIHGQYVSFSEIGFRVVYDITNDINLHDYYTLESLENWEYVEGCDVMIVDAIKDGDDYYVNLKL